MQNELVANEERSIVGRAFASLSNARSAVVGAHRPMHVPMSRSERCSTAIGSIGPSRQRHRPAAEAISRPSNHGTASLQPAASEALRLVIRVPAAPSWRRPRRGMRCELPRRGRRDDASPYPMEPPTARGWLRVTNHDGVLSAPSRTGVSVTSVGKTPAS